MRILHICSGSSGGAAVAATRLAAAQSKMGDETLIVDINFMKLFYKLQVVFFQCFIEAIDIAHICFNFKVYLTFKTRCINYRNCRILEIERLDPTEKVT